MSTQKTVEVSQSDLLNMGFVPYRWTEMSVGVKTHDTYLIHASVAEAAKFKYYLHNDWPVLIPKTRTCVVGNDDEYVWDTVIEYWEAKFGALWYTLRTYAELEGFMQTFNYTPQ